MDARKRLLGEEHHHTISAMGNLAATYYQLRKYAHSKKLYICVVDARKGLLGAEDPHTNSAMADLAQVYKKRGRHADAEKLEVHGMNARTRLLGEHHPKITFGGYVEGCGLRVWAEFPLVVLR